ncbi:MAG: ACP S-malonyltransferase [Planctomycetes bacterium]|nr:ACP S-malonyltransferase [Planctomycetota bacterium]
MTRALVLCPGRGSYTEKTLRSLPEEHRFVARAEVLRREYGLPALVELDRAAKFDAKTHLAPIHASPLIWLVSMIDAEAAGREHQISAVAGNSMGWYTALAVAGALDFDDGFRLMQEMSLLQQEHGGGGQILFPQVDEHWRRDAQLVGALEEALASSGGEAFPSIRLGGQAVLAGSEAGIAHLLRTLPKVKLGQNIYPFRLVGHGPYHTPLVQAVADKAREKLSRLAFHRPRFTLIDGSGRRHSPWSASPDALRDYTFGAQITTAYDVTLSVRVGLREFAPERIVLPGPGNPLGSICAQILIEEGWRGLHSRADFEALQGTADPIVHSMRR